MVSHFDLSLKNLPSRKTELLWLEDEKVNNRLWLSARREGDHLVYPGNILSRGPLRQETSGTSKLDLGQTL